MQIPIIATLANARIDNFTLVWQMPAFAVCFNIIGTTPTTQHKIDVIHFNYSPTWNLNLIPLTVIHRQENIPLHSPKTASIFITPFSTPAILIPPHPLQTAKCTWNVLCPPFFIVYGILFSSGEIDAIEISSGELIGTVSIIQRLAGSNKPILVLRAGSFV